MCWCFIHYHIVDFHTSACTLDYHLTVFTNISHFCLFIFPVVYYRILHIICRYSAVTLFPFWWEFYCSDKFLEVKKLHFYTNRKLHICTQIISRPAFFLTLLCVLEVFQLGLLDVILYIR